MNTAQHPAGAPAPRPPRPYEQRLDTPPPQHWIDSPTLRLDDAGRAEAARVIARRNERTDRPFDEDVNRRFVRARP